MKKHGYKINLPSIVKLFLLLLDLPINLLANLAKLKLSPQDLVLFLFKCSLSLFKSSLELFLLNLKTPPLLVKLMDGTATVSKLVKQVLDFISKVLVLPLYNIKLLNGFIPSGLQPEAFTVIVPALLCAGLQLIVKIINLLLPFTDNLNKFVRKIS